jgi:hypothetical protein
MRKNRTELMAIPLTLVLLGVLFAVFAAASAGLWAWIVAGVLILGAILYFGVRFANSRVHPPELQAPRVTPADDGAYKVLVVADDAADPGAIRNFVVSHAAGRPTLAYVLAPALSSRLDRLTGDEDAYRNAERHLQATLDALQSVSTQQSGKVASHDPVQAVDEGLREFAADEVLLAMSADHTNWLEDGVVDVCRERYEVPVTPLVGAAPLA